MATADASQTGLVWFKRDLRLADNPALHAAVRSGRPLILLYIRDDDRAISLSPGRASDWWLHQSLDALTSQLGQAGGPAPGLAPNVDHVAIKLAAFDETAIRAYLDSKGVDSEPAKTRFGARGDGPSIYMKDPDGNGVELTGTPS